jgi:hypothetical protein
MLHVFLHTSTASYSLMIPSPTLYILYADNVVKQQTCKRNRLFRVLKHFQLAFQFTKCCSKVVCNFPKLLSRSGANHKETRTHSKLYHALKVGTTVSHSFPWPEKKITD